MIETTPVPLPNRKALTGFITAVLTLVSFCAGLAPIPFLSIICYPASFLLGFLSLVLGLSALRQIRQNGEDGRTLALIAAWTGGITILATLCMVTAGILLWPYISDSIQQALNQIRP